MKHSSSWNLDRTLTDILREHVRQKPDLPALVWNGKPLTFAQLDEQSDRLAAGLAGCGIGRGDVVSCQLPNTPEYLILHHAVAKRRAILNPIHLLYRTSEVEPMLRFAKTSMIVMSPPVKDFSYVDMALDIQKRVSTLYHIVSVGEEKATGAISFDSLLQNSSAFPLDVDGATADDPFVIIFTSGTTSSPKATVHSHRMRLGNANICATELGIRTTDRLLCLSAFSHMWGMKTYWMGLSQGVCHILIGKYRPDALFSTLIQNQPTFITGAPPHAMDLLDSPQFDPKPIGGIRSFALSGAVCSPQLMKRLRSALPQCTPPDFLGNDRTRRRILYASG